MTAPALVLLATHASAATMETMQRLKLRVSQFRPDLRIQAACAMGHPSLTASARVFARQGVDEAVCVPVEAARIEASSPELERAVAITGHEVPEVQLSLSNALGAPGKLFSLVDRRLHDSLQRNRARELDSLLLVHDAGDDGQDLARLSRRARVWGQRHRLPYRLAPLGSPAAISSALTSLSTNGRRHVGVALLSVLATEEARTSIARDPRVVAVGGPLGHDDAVVEEILTQYAIGALRALPFDSHQVVA